MKSAAHIFKGCVLSFTLFFGVPAIYGTACDTSLLYTRLVLNNADENGPLNPKVRWTDFSLIPAEEIKVLEPSRVLPAVLQVVGDRVHSGHENPLRLSAQTKQKFAETGAKNFVDFETTLNARRMNSLISTGPIEFKGRKAGSTSVQRLRINGKMKYFRPAEPDDADDFLGPAKMGLVRKTFVVDEFIRTFSQTAVTLCQGILPS